jgi:PAS domain S-box-containing protein
MRTSCFLFILLIIPFIANSAEVNESTGRKEHILCVDSLNKLANDSIDTNEKLARFSANEAFSLANQINYPKGQVEALVALARYYHLKEDYVKTLELYFKIIDLHEYYNDNRGLIIGYTRVIQLFLLIKDYDLAEKYLVMMSHAAQRSQTAESYAQMYYFQAKYYYAMGEYDHAIRNFYLCIPYFRGMNDQNFEGGTYKLLGDAYVQKKKYNLAQFNYRMAIAVLQTIPNLTELSVIYTRIAHIYQVLNNHKLNLEFNLLALKIREETGHPVLISSSCLNVGEAYWFLGKKEEAHLYLERSLKLAEKIKKTDLLEAIYSQYSTFAKAENRHDDALNYFTRCVECRSKMNQDRNRLEILILDANRTIRASETQNDLLNQEILFQELQIRNRRVEIFLFEVVFLLMLLLILFVDAVVRRNHKRKNELKLLNERLTYEIDTRIKAEGRLNRNEELHRFLAENTVDVISLMDVNLQRLYISPSCEKFYGYPIHEIMKMTSPLDLVEQPFHVYVNQRLIEMFRSKNSTRYLYKVMRKDGATFWAEASINPIINPVTNEIKNLITVVRDISERVKYEEELSENSRQKEYLLREIHNRVKNNFAILVSLMNMQRDQSDNPELSSSLTDLQLRVRTMSLVHEQLYHAKEISTIPFDNYLYHLSLIISSSFNNKHIQLVTVVQPCKVAIEMALPLGLIINELITNAYKYAFPGNREGTIRVSLTPENEEKFCISICDDGVGLPGDFTMNNTKSMGSQIVGILVEQIEAVLEVTSNGGACFRILFSTSLEK